VEWQATAEPKTTWMGSSIDDCLAPYFRPFDIMFPNSKSCLSLNSGLGSSAPILHPPGLIEKN
jgi:hypothetical protein